VTTAFPAVSKIIDAIWPKPDDKSNDKKTAKTAEQAKTALQPVKSAADSDQKKNLADLKEEANNLAVTRTFVTASADVITRISVMQALLAARPPGASANDDLTAPEKAKLQDLWGPAKSRLDALQTDAVQKEIDGVTDSFLQATFTDIRNGITDNGTNITNQIAQGRTSDLKNSLTQLAPKFSNIVPLTGILIGDLGQSLQKAVNNIAGAAGTETDPLAEQDRQRNLILIQDVNKQH
jgi:hypothetical protein